MSFEIKVPTIDGLTLKTKDTYVDKDIAITIGIPRYDGSASEDVTPNEDALIERTLTIYRNDRVTTIGNNAFRDNTTIEEVSFPNVTTINRVAFYGCTNLKSINFPKVIATIDQVFSGCTSLVKADMSTVETLGSMLFRNCTKLEIVRLKNAKNMGSGTFADCTSLKALVISNESVVISMPYTNVFNNSSITSGSGYVYAPDILLEDYKSSTNWSTFADQIKPLSELPQEIKNELGME